MKFEISRVWNNKLTKNQKEILKKYNLDIIVKEVKHTYTPTAIEENYFIEINKIEDLVNISKELNEELIIDKDNTITIYDDYIE